MITEIYEGLVNTLNTDLSKAHYRISGVKVAATNDVECSIKVMLGNMNCVGIGQSTKYDHTGWIYFDFGSNERRGIKDITVAIDELLDWIATNYEIGKGFDIGSGYYIRDMEHIPFQGYPQPKELFFQELILVRFIWERR